MSEPAPNDRRKTSSSRRSDRNPEDGNRPMFSGSWALMFIVLMFIALYWWRASPSNTGTRVPYSFLWSQVSSGNVDSAVRHGEVITGEFKESPPNPRGKGDLGTKFNAVLIQKQDDPLLDLMREKGVNLGAMPQEVSFGMQLIVILGLILVSWGAFWFLVLRRNSDPMGTGMIGNFIRSPAKRFRPSDHQTTFDDVAAMEQAKAELQEIVEFLKNPGKFQRLGAQIPKGVLLMGPPGTGKTLLARAVAGEAGVPFFSINGSEFIQMFVGVGASRVRDMFRTAKDNAPCILFIDEIDAVGRVRGAGLGGGHDEREQTLNQILSEMDGFQQTEAVIVVAATNRPDVLDPALLRPGRFDRHVTVDRPTRIGRLAILKVHCRKVPLAENVNLERVAAGTIGFSGAELKNLVNEAALNAARDGRDSVTDHDFEASRDKVLMGPRREEILSPHERAMTAYHEAGHALLSWLQPEVDSLHKVTIIPRGRALGVTQLLPNEERYNIGERRLHAQLAFMLGGRAAEKLVFNEYSAGAEDDLSRASGIARRMVARWGMSDVIGPASFRDSEEHPFLGKEFHSQRDHSEETTRLIDGEVQRFLTQADHRAMKTLSDHRDKLDGLSKALLEKEELDDAQISAIIGEPVPRSDVLPSTTAETQG
jgi:cell division protease FtsH